MRPAREQATLAHSCQMQGETHWETEATRAGSLSEASPETPGLESMRNERLFQLP